MNKLLVVVDAQNDFMKSSGALYVNGAESTIDLTNKFLEQVTYENGYAGAIFTKDTHIPEVYATSEEGKQFPPHCVKGTTGHDLAVNHLVIPDTVPSWILEKGVFNMWEEPVITAEMYNDTYVRTYTREDLVEHYKNIDVTEVEVIGHALNFCVKWAIDGWVKNGFHVTLYENLSCGIDVGNGEMDTKAENVFKDYIDAGKVTIKTF